MSNKYSTVKLYFMRGLWNTEKVRNAVVKGWITEAEYEDITGDGY